MDRNKALETLLIYKFALTCLMCYMVANYGLWWLLLIFLILGDVVNMIGKGK
ncbi:MAG: hypothetical protein RR571_06295 [Anaerorhabdus sp.]|jgi:hypothetical protein|uniref:hypothetical protein n=1 Tax=Anaerorhabdus sp. TaxID=1872524 RepID=UPI002FC89476